MNLDESRPADSWSKLRVWMDRGTAAYAVRRRTARPECNDGRLLSREDWEGCEVI